MDEDTELLSGIASGDQRAMERFYHRHASAVYGFALKTLRNPVDASEVLNEVMLQVWQKAGSFAARSSVKTWLLSITHHKAVDAVRKNVRHDHEDEDLIDRQAPENLSCSVLDLELSSENGEQVRHCLDELPGGHRQVVYLTFFEGYSYPDIANTLAIPEGTVKTRMMNAKKRLLDCLGQFLPQPQSL